MPILPQTSINLQCHVLPYLPLPYLKATLPLPYLSQSVANPCPTQPCPPKGSQFFILEQTPFLKGGKHNLQSYPPPP